MKDRSTTASGAQPAPEPTPVPVPTAGQPPSGPMPTPADLDQSAVGEEDPGASIEEWLDTDEPGSGPSPTRPPQTGESSKAPEPGDAAAPPRQRP